MVTEPTDTQTFIFSHIEYDRWGLDSEYKREVAAHPEISYKRAKHYYHHKNDYDHPKFNWKKRSERFLTIGFATSRIIAMKTVRRLFREALLW